MDEIDANAPVVETGPVLETGWTDILLICRKCSKKLNGGFGKDGDETLARAVRKALRARGQRGRIGVIGVPCFGICPKRAVTVARASRPGQLRIVRAGSKKESVLF